ncbi:imidazole glycerol phosphate synthase hishf [Lasallia pustulata]|uniref:Imidazole glycerol phosphate synthase hishf n=1 Tax=Lasallia pustulata TaxID=136370 RepID=A0A1W5D6Y5_9LECA|nr:imidazole glycerol phosphate synthase hishf [Lasallia pustulata]
MPTVQLLDYVAGNIRSLVNAIEKLGYDIEWIKSPDDLERASKLIVGTQPLSDSISAPASLFWAYV